MSFYDDASWVLIPEGIKEDVVYAQKPTDGLGDLTFTRASDATRTNSAGVIERTPWNLLTFSEMFSDASWTKTNLTVGANTINSPIGTLTADTLTENTANATHELRTNTITPPVGSINLSVYGKMKERRYLRVGLTVAWGASLGYVVFDLQTGTITYTGGAITGTIENAGDGWYRCSVRGTVTSSVSGTAYIGINGDSTTATTYLGNGTSGIYLWGAQLVEGTDAKPYFATTNRQDVPRLDYRNADGSLSTCPRLLLEPQRTNSIRNSTMVGAVAGTPGTLPTNWNQSGGGGLTTTISLGTENGLQYADIRYSGTATQSFLELRFEANNGISASNGQTWAFSPYIKAISGTIPTSQLVMIERNIASGFIAQGGVGFSATSTLQRFTFTRTLSGGVTVAFVQPLILFTLTIGAAYDFTIRIAAPQMELGAYATTFIPTTTAAVTRLVDVASKTGISSLIGSVAGTAFIDTEFSDTPSSSVNNDILALLNASNVSLGVYSLFIEGSTGNLRIFFLPGNTAITMKSGNNRNQRLKIAFAYANADFVCYVNGTQVYSSTTRPLATGLSAINLHESPRSGLDGINQAALFTRRLTNAELAQITTI
jgi:hypothetical protein